MNKEKLIEEVRRYPFLYDPGDAKYSDIIKKDQAWKNIAGVLSATASECKKSWINLREAYRRALKKQKTKSGQGASSFKKWIFEEEMSFLKPHFKERPSVTSVSDNEENDTINDSIFSLDDINEFMSNDNNDSQTERNTSAEENRPQSSSLESVPTSTLIRPQASNPKFFSNIIKTNKRQRKDDTSSASGQLLKYLLEEKQKPEDEDDIDKFFSSIKATVKKLSAYNQAILKTKIFNLVSEAEIQEIQQQNYYYNSGSAGPSGYSTGSYSSTYNTETSKTQTLNETAAAQSIIEATESEAQGDTLTNL